MEALRDSNIPSIIVDVQIVQIYTIGIRAKNALSFGKPNYRFASANLHKKIQLAKKNITHTCKAL